MDLEGDEALEGGVFFIGVSEVCAEFSVKVCLEVGALAFDDDGVPVIPFEEFFALGGEGFFSFGVGVFRGEEPASACFVIDASGP